MNKEIDEMSEITIGFIPIFLYCGRLQDGKTSDFSFDPLFVELHVHEDRDVQSIQGTCEPFVDRKRQ